MTPLHPTDPGEPSIITPTTTVQTSRLADTDAASTDIAIEPVAAAPAACGCGCAPDATGRKAVGVDVDAKIRNTKRLRRIEGQVRGIQKMVEEDRYCADILTQLSSVQEALRAVSRELMRNHLKHCAASALRGSPAVAEAMYDEVVNLMYTHSR